MCRACRACCSPKQLNTEEEDAKKRKWMYGVECCIEFCKSFMPRQNVIGTTTKVFESQKLKENMLSLHVMNIAYVLD